MRSMFLCFKGIVAKGLSVKERDGQKDFLKIGRFVLSYRLLPLLKKTIGHQQD